MRIKICEDHEQLGLEAAAFAARLLSEAIAMNGEARIIFSTGASQLGTLGALVEADVDWSRVEAFHLDEYLGIEPTHPASFVNYLRERVDSKIGLKAFHYVDVTGDIDESIRNLSRLIEERPVDVGLIGIGENAHIAFNDPPADFDDPGSFKIVDLDEQCRRQQLGEGWFPTLGDVPRRAITMTVSRIMSCRSIVSAVPFAVKAKAVYSTLSAKDVTPMIPATILKTHPDMHLFLDKDSASLLPA